ncbi:MAG: hypothetical protein AAGA40_05510, partial [Cyanobacteria bacterium P01_E01_bin.45]
FIVYFILIALIPVVFQESGNLNVWDASYPLVLENEYTQDRPWNGSVKDLLIWNKAFESQSFYNSCTLCAKSYESYLFSYFQGTSPCQISCIIPLDNFDRSAGYQTSLQNDISLETDSSLIFPSVANLNGQIALSSKFTLFGVFESIDDAQVGPARIISISKGLFARNLTIAQERAELIIRLRTQLTGDNGLKPEFIVRGFFRKPGLHKLLVVYDGKTMTVYDNAHLYGVFNLSPSLSLFKHILPAKIDNLGSNNVNLLYSFAITFPFGLLTYLLLKHSNNLISFLLVFSFALAIFMKILFFSLIEPDLLWIRKIFACALAFCFAFCASSIYLSTRRADF